MAVAMSTETGTAAAPDITSAGEPAAGPPVRRGPVTTASYSLTIRLSAEGDPTSIGRIATAVGSAGGVVTAIDVVEQRLTVVTDEDEAIGYDFGELDELVHAYAVTVHRSQGSEYPCVVIPLTTSAWMMLQRNLLYTAVTRAKRLVVLVGSTRALGQAVRAAGSGRRHTALAARLRGGIPAAPPG